MIAGAALNIALWPIYTSVHGPIPAASPSS
jgi:hypothetical protein